MYTKLETDTQLSRTVAQRIKSLIQEKKLTPGDKLPNEMELARLFAVSRPTVREAVKALVSQNIIEIRRGRGTFVSQNPGVVDDPLGLDFMSGPDLPLSLVEARLIIEPGVARLAARNADEEDLASILLYIHKMEEVVDHHQVEINPELEFHRSIVRAAKNPVLLRIVPVILDSIIKTYEDSPRTTEDHRQALREHRLIYEAIKKRSAEEAFLAMQNHLENSYRRTLKKFKTNPPPR
ncbi:MAG: FadR family transcriptional regulator [Spirochaetales bacterium]|jgi:DNA-binding FadR family transcriptional regulator|nr:FadR family transcriptional regulator [Spirochaetales bacterium]